MIARRLLFIVAAGLLASAIVGCTGHRYTFEVWVTDRDGSPIEVPVTAFASPRGLELVRLGSPSNEAHRMTNSEGYASFTISNVRFSQPIPPDCRATYEPCMDTTHGDDQMTDRRIDTVDLWISGAETFPDFQWLYQLVSIPVPFDSGWISGDHDCVELWRRNADGSRTLASESVDRQRSSGINTRIRVTKP